MPVVKFVVEHVAPEQVRDRAQHFHTLVEAQNAADTRAKKRPGQTYRVVGCIAISEHRETELIGTAALIDLNFAVVTLVLGLGLLALLAGLLGGNDDDIR